eukprot:TRINITY_DN12215_c0_g1_i2.p1 TRINITY_DN12215_c0_g1~~TRINITY_DN12215_c0_g1_i2.p1  ORF type:complete len:272 (-),score=7.95 TRINITY_DN12215_c0_g1_i2:169-963(-)
MSDDSVAIKRKSDIPSMSATKRNRARSAAPSITEIPNVVVGSDVEPSSFPAPEILSFQQIPQPSPIWAEVAPIYNRPTTGASSSRAMTHATSAPSEKLALLPRSEEGEEKFLDITEFLSLPQSDAAKKLGIPTSSSRAMTHATSAPSEKLALLPRSEEGEEKFLDITEFLSLPQSDAAKKLGIPTSTLSKRWKEAVRNRKWPYRSVCKIDKEILTILHNLPPEARLFGEKGELISGSVPPEVENDLAELLRKRKDFLQPVVIRL